MKLENIFTEHEILVSIHAAKVREIVLERLKDTGLINFHVTLGPDALDHTPEELAEKVMSWYRHPYRTIESIDGDTPQTRFDAAFVSQPPVTNQPSMDISEFVKQFNK